MGMLIGFIGLIAIGVGIYGLIKGSAPRFKVKSKRDAWIAIVVGFAVAAAGGAIREQEEKKGQQ